MNKKRIDVFSFGGGVNSYGLLALIADGRLPKPRIAIMSDTSRESTLTMNHIDKYARPIMAGLGIPFYIVGHEYSKVDLYGHNGDLLLPAYTKTGRLPTFCSSEWKRFVVRRKLKELGYNYIRMWFAMTLDEVGRLRMSDVKWIENYYPMCQIIKQYRASNKNFIKEVLKIPIPYKSACWMCPNRTTPEFREQAENCPDDHQKAIEIDDYIREADSMGGVFVSEYRKPLSTVDLNAPQLNMFDFCSQYCMT